MIAAMPAIVLFAGDMQAIGSRAKEKLSLILDQGLCFFVGFLKVLFNLLNDQLFQVNGLEFFQRHAGPFRFGNGQQQVI